MNTTDTAALGGEPPFFPLRVVRKSRLARDIWGFDLREPSGAALPAFTAGSHLTLELPGGLRRNYSLCGDPADTRVYQIAVKREAAGRGGSVRLVDQVQEGDLVAVSAPRNNFPLHPRAASHLFIAGGIGITPILSMMRQLAGGGSTAFQLIYCTRDAEHTAFQEVLAAPPFSGQVRIHHDHGDPAQAFDFWPLLETPGKGHVYCCGPRGLMDAVADMSGHWPTGAIHFERFGIDTSTLAPDTAFQVRLQRSGACLQVPVGQTLLDALRGAGHRVPSSCESGTCGSCRTGLLAGEADHRDLVLNEDERASQIMVCVSRARSAELVLDL